jgi:hypothetical protein
LIANGGDLVSFDDIKIAYTNIHGMIGSSEPIVFTCFVIKKKDSTYSKIQILNKLADNRYVFKYGTNTIPNDSMLINADYDRSVRYKPNNVAFCGSYPGEYDSLHWDPGRSPEPCTGQTALSTKNCHHCFNRFLDADRGLKID